MRRLRRLVLLIAMMVWLWPFCGDAAEGDRATHRSDHDEDVIVLPPVHVHGLPLNKDNKTVVQERFFISKDNPDHLHDEITTIDNALTRPWTVLKTYRRERNAIFSEGYCAVDNPHVKIGNENYMLGADGLLMPAKKGQKPPDLRYFK